MALTPEQKAKHDEQLAVALSELQLEGSIEWKSDRAFQLTIEGVKRAEERWHAFSVRDHVLLMSYIQGLLACADEPWDDEVESEGDPA